MKRHAASKSCLESRSKSESTHWPLRLRKRLMPTSTRYKSRRRLTSSSVNVSLRLSAMRLNNRLWLGMLLLMLHAISWSRRLRVSRPRVRLRLTPS